MTSRKRDHTSNWNSSISSRTSNFKIRSSSFSLNVGPAGFFPEIALLTVVPTFLVVALDGGRGATPLLVVDELPAVVFGFWADTRGFIGLTCDVVPLETVRFLGEIAFAVPLDLTGRAVTTVFITVVGRDAAVGRAVVVLVVAVAVLIVVAGRVGLAVAVVAVPEVEATVGRVLVAAGLWEEALIGWTFVAGILEGAALDLAVPKVGFGFNLEAGGSRNRSSASSSDEGTK